MITNVESASTPTDPSPYTHPLMFKARLIAAGLLLLPAIWFSWITVNGLARRVQRTDLAEIEHARYGILSADQWRSIIGPMLDAQVDKLDLKDESKNLRPMVERSLYALLDNIKTQMTTPSAKTQSPAGATGQTRRRPPNPDFLGSV